MSSARFTAAWNARPKVPSESIPAALVRRMGRKGGAVASPPREPRPMPAVAPDAGAAPERWQDRLRKLGNTLFSLDMRSVALFRVGLGLMLIADLLYRSQDLQAHYTDDGVLPLALLSIVQGQRLSPTLHAMHGSLSIQVALFILAGILAFSLTIGYRTRASTFCSWIMLISLQNRNSLVLTGEDSVLRMLVFWGMFLPLGALWSVDHALDRSDPQVPPQVVSLGSAGIIVQMCLIYWFGAVLKSDPSWRSDNTAVWYALSIDQFATPLALTLLHYPQLLKALTFLTWRLEMLGAYLILTSAFSPQLRTLVVFVFIGFHLSLGLCLELGLFPLACAVGWLILLPPWFWETLSRRTAKIPKRTLIRSGSPLHRLIARVSGSLHPEPVRTALHRTTQGVAAFFLLYIVLWNIRGIEYPRYKWVLPANLDVVAELTRVDQNWALFAPAPMKDRGWMIVAAQLKDGAGVDLFQEVSPVNWEPPGHIADLYINDRWRKYLLNLCLPENQAYRYFYAQYLYHKWSAVYKGDRRITEIRIYYVRHTALPNYKFSEWKREELFTFTPRD